MNENYDPNVWKKGTVLLALIVVVLVVIIILDYKKYDDEKYNSIEEQMCKNIKGTPAWANWEGRIFEYGYREFTEGNMSVDKFMVVNSLIEEQIHFLYHPDCVYCVNQIKYFDYAWQDYVDSDYAVNCEEVLR